MKGLWRSTFVVICMCAGGTAHASVAPQDMLSAGMSSDLLQYAVAVTRNEGKWTDVNSYGCVGAFQFCPGTFEHYYHGSVDSFLKDKGAQVSAFVSYEHDNWMTARRNGLTSAIGKTVCWNNSCTTITASSILMACQFGCGQKGKLAHFVQNGYSCNGVYNTADGNGTSVCKYLYTGANYNVSAITNMDDDSARRPQCLGDLASVELALSVPYGSVRGGKDGAEWEQHSIGLSAKSSDGMPSVKSGLSGQARWYPTSAPSGSSVTISDGSIRLSYSGLSGVSGKVDGGQEGSSHVSAGQEIGFMMSGKDGQKPSFNLALAASQKALKAAGLSGRAGASVPCENCTTSTSTGNTALASDKLADAASRSFYYVNPETFLGKRASVLPEAVSAYPQAFSGRSSSQTLPTTCDAGDTLMRSSPASSGSGSSVDGGTDGVSGYRGGSDDYAANIAAQAEHGLWLELARDVADDLRVKSRGSEATDEGESAIAHLGLLEMAGGSE